MFSYISFQDIELKWVHLRSVQLVLRSDQFLNSHCTYFWWRFLQASFFLTYVLSSGWASLSCEVMQIFPLTCNLIRRWILRIKNEPFYEPLKFPYHTEVPRILLFGFLGFTCSILAPLITPFLLFYFFLAYLVYKNQVSSASVHWITSCFLVAEYGSYLTNLFFWKIMSQILNVYISKYETGGQFWPIAHNATIFAMIVAQIIALGVFGIKKSPVASGFTIPLIIGTLLFYEYCRQRFLPIFRNTAAEVANSKWKPLVCVCVFLLSSSTMLLS